MRKRIEEDVEVGSEACRRTREGEEKEGERGRERRKRVIGEGREWMRVGEKGGGNRGQRKRRRKGVED